MTKLQQNALNAILSILELREEVEEHSKSLIVSTKDEHGEYQIFMISPRGRIELFGLIPMWYNDKAEDYEFSINHIKKMLKHAGVKMHTSKSIKDKIRNLAC